MNALVFSTFLAIAQAAEPNPCTNGSFEALTENGAPVDWNILNQGGVIDTDAHTGGRCLCLVRLADGPHPETGLNHLSTPRGREDVPVQTASVRQEHLGRASKPRASPPETCVCL